VEATVVKPEDFTDTSVLDQTQDINESETEDFDTQGSIQPR
jgi:hypothetical protein